MVTAVEYNPRYELLGCIARGTMASIHLARMTEGTGSSRIVVVKRLHREHTFDKNSVAILNEEARLWSSVRHANVVGAVNLDVIDGVLGLVLEYVEGETLAELVARASERGEPLPLPFAISIVHGVLRGLKAIHDAQGDDGVPLGIAHRGISPQTILVGTDGSARITDFGMAEARGKSERYEGALREDARRNTAYMPPEGILGSPVDEKGDVYAAGVVLWELLTGERLPTGGGGSATSAAALSEPPSAFRPDVPPELDAVVLRAIAPQAYRRFMTADAFATALEPWHTADERAVGAWVRGLAAEGLALMRGLVHASGIVTESPTSGSEPSFPGVERSNGAELSNEGLFERTVRKVFARTPFAPPANMQHFQLALLAGLASIVVLAYVFLGGMKSEPEATLEEPATAEPTLAAPEPASEPSPVIIATAAPEPVAPVPSTLPTPAPVAEAAPVVDAPVRGVSIATPARAPMPMPKSDASPRPRPVRRAAVPVSTATSSPPPKAVADNPGALKDYR